MLELGSEMLDVKVLRWGFMWPQQALDTQPLCGGPSGLPHPGKLSLGLEQGVSFLPK